MESLELNWGSSEEKKGWRGLNNAAINSFNNNIINSFVREMFQNSNDARDKNLPIDKNTGNRPPLHIVINYKKIDKKRFPDFSGFVDVFNRIKSAKPNERHVEFFRHADDLLKSGNSLKLFVYEDFNTTGLTGNDDDDNSTFSGCVLSEGTSIGKDKTAGGSYGIGKNAIFGFSKLRTVFYTSLNSNGEYIFQGIAKLATYNGKDGKKHSDRIFCGHGSEQRSIRNFDQLASEFRDVFRRDKPGLSQFAVCPVEHVNWIEEFSKAILRNYWLLLDKGELVVELREEDVLKKKIDNGNLEYLLKEYFRPELFDIDENVNPNGNPYDFYRCYKFGKRVTTKVDIIGNVRFYYSEQDNNQTNSVAYVRNNMIVYTQSVHGFSSINYCGVFICDDEEGNGVLRDMEPPTHDSFSPERLDEKSERYNSRDGRKILNGIKSVVRESLQTISDKYKTASQDIPWLNDLLSSVTGAAGTGLGKRTNKESESETTERIGAELNVKVELSSLRRNTLVNNPRGDDEGIGGGTSDGSAGGSGSGRGTEGNSGRGGGVKGTNKSKKTTVKSRIFRTSKKTLSNGIEYFEYKVFVNSETLVPATDLLISQKGDNGNVAFFDISNVRDSQGSQLDFLSEKNLRNEATAYRIKSVAIPCELSMLVAEPYKSSFKIVKG